ncbi:HAD family phosphatase [uncultured Enterococcus sp.]|uniref:HAD family hydrolase n=1 Tax=uncultured Enterococcus sp. TaxID=167972 RepID=UPI0026154B06|nr:HAD family phosphatase [uncultured Enterococcus sp.]
MYRAVIFDMDGVIVDSEAAYLKRRLDFFNRLGEIPEHTQLQDFVGLSNEAVWQQLVSDAKKRERLKRKYDQYQNENSIKYQKYLIPHVIDFLEEIHAQKKKVALASASNPQHITLMLSQCQLSKYFDVVISGENVKRNKPFPDIYLKASEQLAVLPAECLVIEDSFNGILAAKRAKMDVWALKPQNYTIDQKSANCIFQNFIEMKEHLIDW